jgi:hypothetical protein
MTYVWIPDPARQERSDLPSPYYNLAVVELDGTVGTPSRVVTNDLVSQGVDAQRPVSGERADIEAVRRTLQQIKVLRESLPISPQAHR